MQNNLRRILIAVAVALGGFGALSTAQAAMPAKDLIVPLNRAEMVTVPADISEVIIANPDIADVYVHGKTKISVVGKAIGTTNMRVLDEDSNILRTVAVRVTYDLPGIRQSLYQFFPYEDIAVQMVNNNVALTGSVSSASVAQKAVRIANEFMLPTAQERPADGFAPTNDISSGTDVGVINMMKVTSGQQVMLRVRVGEIQRNTLKQLGVNWSAANAGNFAFGTGSDFDAGLPGDNVFGVGGDTFATIAGQVNIGGGALSASLDALERNNLFKLLAEPNLVAISGEEAEFLSGGEFPIPVVQGGDSDAVTIQYREFGVAVQFRPHVLSNNRIRLQVRPEVSELSNVGSVTLGGFTVPGLTTRRANTTVELAPGESFMIAGLIRDRLDSNIDQVPGIGEIPVLSSLFRNTEFDRTESELVIAVTPYLVDPVMDGDIRLPTDRFRAPSMMEQFFYGAISASSEKTMRTSQTPALEGPIGFMVD